MGCEPCHPAPVFVMILGLFILFGVLVVTIIKVLVYCKIFSNAGYSWALGLLMLVPIANIIMLFVLAFAEWPIRKELRLLKQQRDTAGG